MQGFTESLKCHSRQTVRETGTKYVNLLEVCVIFDYRNTQIKCTHRYLLLVIHVSQIQKRLTLNKRTSKIMEKHKGKESINKLGNAGIILVRSPEFDLRMGQVA
jgi:hypothetical protein